MLQLRVHQGKVFIRRLLIWPQPFRTHIFRNNGTRPDLAYLFYKCQYFCLSDVIETIFQKEVSDQVLTSTVDTYTGKSRDCE